MGRGLIDIATTTPLIEFTNVYVSSEQVRLRLFVPRRFLFTSEIPGFAQLLLSHLPALCSTICHNDEGLSFAEELCATEMGHAVEHIVLALLTEHGIYAKGMTEWNWFEEPEGTFQITLFDGLFDVGTVQTALAKTVEVLGAMLAHLRLAVPAGLDES